MAIRSFFKMNEFGINKSIMSCNTLLNAIIQTKRFDLVHTLDKNCWKFGIFLNVFTCNILTKALCQMNDLESAFRIISKGWVPDPVTYIVMIDGFCKKKRLMDVVKLINDMEENGVLPNDVTYGVVIGKWGKALILLNEILEKKFMPCPTLYSKIVDLLGQEGNLLKRNCTAYNTIYSTLIYWLFKVSNLKRQGSFSMSLKKDDMLEKGCIPNVFTCNMLIKWFSITGRASEGLCQLVHLCHFNGWFHGSKDEIMKLLVATTSHGFLLDLDLWGWFVDKVIMTEKGRNVYLEEFWSVLLSCLAYN
ncbi:hypothetical protein AMTRI_Chr01g130780 [Amborella trichopoda]